MKKPIAIWMPGGVGGGYYSQGIPVITKLIDDLSNVYTISIYSLHRPNKDFKPGGYELISIDKRIQFNWLRWILLGLLFLKNHSKKKYQLLYAFWGFPAGVVTVVLSKLVSLPSIIHLQGGDAVHIPSIGYGSLNGYSKKLMLWAYHRCTMLIALTAFQKGKLIEAGLKRSVEVISYGPDLKLFLSSPGVTQSQPIHFLHVGNLLPVKDQITLLNAFASITKSISAELRIIGEDHLNGLVQERCRKLHLQHKVEFIDIQPYEKMPLHYTWADVLLMTSVYEGQCMAIAEAAASGVLIAGTRVGMLADWNDHFACVVEISDAEALASEVVKTIQNPEDMYNRTEQARKEVIGKDRDWTFKEICKCIENCLSTHL